MEFRSVRQVAPRERPGEQKQQMLDLNRRLETYLNRVKLLEEENGLLAEEIRAVRRGDRGVGTRRNLEGEVGRARLEAEAAWRDGLLTELEVEKMAEELRALDRQRQRELRAKTAAEVKLEQSRKHLEEERRAQVWLAERVALLEHEMRLLVQTHRDRVAQLEAEPTRLRVTPPAQRESRTPTLLQLGQEYSQRADRAWQGAAEAHRGQVAQLEESLHEVRARLTREGREGQQSRLKLHALEKEIASAREVRQHLEKTAGQQRHVHQQEVQRLQEYLDSLEAEKEKISQQIHGLLLENQQLLQMKMSLGLEVATYRALLDGEGVKGGIRTFKQPRNTSIADAALSPPGVQKGDQIHLSGSHKTTSSPRIRKPTPISNAAPPYCRSAQQTTQENSDPKTLLGDAVESLQPQEVHEKVTHAEAPSSCDDQESAAGSREWGALQSQVQPPAQTPLVQSVVSHQAESVPSGGPSLHRDHHSSTPSLLASHVSAAEETCGGTAESAGEQEDAPQSRVPVKPWTNEPMENEPDEHSDSETKAVLEPRRESRTSSPESDRTSQEVVTVLNLDENMTEIKQKVGSSTVGGEDDDKLYPDGEEMDTWDSVMEKKVHLTSGEGMKSQEGKRRHAEPEEDISEHKKKEFGEQTDEQQENTGGSSQMVPEGDRQNAAPEEQRASGSDEDDSQNVSVSWRTEIESDNTLADTRPLIRYQSDETEANARSESSDGERDGRDKEMGMWTEDKATRFGTMEDLCEEIEGEMADEHYHLESIQTEEMNFGQDSAACEQLTSASEEENDQCLVTEQNQNQSEMKSEPLNMGHEEERETDGLEEEELESLSRHPAEQQIGEETPHLTEASGQQVTKSGGAEETTTHHNEGLIPSSTRCKQMSDNLYSTASSVRMDRTHTVAHVQHQDHRPGDTPEEPDQDQELEASVTTEIQSGFTDLILADTKISEEPESDQKNQAVVADQPEVKEALLSADKNADEDLFKTSQEMSEDMSQPQLEQSVDDLERYQEISGNQQQAQLGNVVETYKESEEELAEGAPDSQSQHGDTVEASRMCPHQPAEDLPDSQDCSSNLQQCLLDGSVEPSRDIHEQHVEDMTIHLSLQQSQLEVSTSNGDPEQWSGGPGAQEAPETQLYDAMKSAPESQGEDHQELSGFLQKPPSPEQSEESTECPDQLREDAEDSQKRFGSPKQPPGDKFMDALKMTTDQPGEDAADPREFSRSFEPQSDTFKDKSQDVVDCQGDFIVEAFDKSEDDAEPEDFPETPQTSEWEVLEKPSEIQDQKIPHQKSQTEARLTDDHTRTPQDQLLWTPPGSVLGRQDIFMLKDATESRMPDFFSSSLKRDFWGSSLEGGATFQPPEENNAATHTDHKTGFARNVIQGSSENQTAVRGNSKVESDLLELAAAEEGGKETPAGGRQEQCGSAEREVVQWEESEAESCSSEE